MSILCQVCRTIDGLMVVTNSLYYIIVVAVKRYFDSQVRASKTLSPEEGQKKRVVSRRTKVFYPNLNMYI